MWKVLDEHDESLWVESDWPAEMWATLYPYTPKGSETIGLLVQDGSSGAYEISDAIMGAAMLEQLEPIKDSIGTNVANISELRAMCERKLEDRKSVV